eukprot:g14071.t1
MRFGLGGKLLSSGVWTVSAADLSLQKFKLRGHTSISESKSCDDKADDGARLRQPLIVKDCTLADGCEPQNVALVLDAQYGCVQSADHFHTNGDEVQMGDGIGYVCADPDCKKYKKHDFLNKEIAVTMDVHNAECHMNSGVISREMPLDGWASEGGFGAAKGDGACDANCLSWRPWWKGEKNGNAHAACCFQTDIWNGNKEATASTTHNCRSAGLTDGKPGDCDGTGCNFNPFRNGQHDFWGPGKEVDTEKNVTVVTQFLTSNSVLKEVRTFYIQDGKLIGNAKTTNEQIPGGKWDSITDGYCAARAEAFSEPDGQADMGGLAKMGESFQRGHVLMLTFSEGMAWLDAYEPHDVSRAEASKKAKGVERGPCPAHLEKGEAVQKANLARPAVFSDIRFGEVGSCSVVGSCCSCH